MIKADDKLSIIALVLYPYELKQTLPAQIV